MNTRLLGSLLASFALAGLVSNALALDPTRDGSGAVRSALDKLELKPFPNDAWSKLKDWKNGGPLTEGLIKDKVVLVLTYSDFAPAAHRAFQMCQRLATKYSKDGLLIVAAHNARGWEDAEKPAVADGSLLLAHDTAGDFRTALAAPSDPDFYLVDRSGQLRFAGIATEAVEDGVKQLLGESSDKAAGTRARLDAEKADRDREERKSRAARADVDLTKFPDLPFKKPKDEEYEKAKWPPTPRDPDRADEIAYLDPREVTPPEGDWVPTKPNIDGKIVVMYFWHPTLMGTYHDIFPLIDQLAREYTRDVVFVGVLTVFDNMRLGGQQVEFYKEDKDLDKLKERLEKIGKSRQFDHFLVIDTGNNATFKSVFQDNRDVPLPSLCLVSSDGKARWWSSKASLNWRAALKQMIDADPGVRERRRNEDQWLKNSKGGSGKP